MLAAPPISARQARRPFKLLNRLLRFVRPPRSVVLLVPRAPTTCRPRSANRLLLQLQRIPRRRPLSTTSTPPPCSTSIQLFKSRTVDSDCGSLALKNNDSSGEFGGAFAPAATHDEAALVKIQTFIRRCAVRLRLRNECGPENICIIKSQVLCRVSPWFSPVAPGSPTAARHLAAARVIAGFIDRDIIKWFITRRRLAFNSAVRLVQKWFRGIRVIRLALNLFAPILSTNSHLMLSWCI